MSKGLVLVTGANGFIGTAVTRAFIDAGFSVRGTVRSLNKGEDWEQWNPEYKGKVEWVIVKDISAENAFDEVIKGVKYVAHTASPFHFNFTDNEKEMLQPAIRGTTAMMKAAKAEPSVEHMVITSSAAAIFNLSKWPSPGYTYTGKDWNPATYEDAAKSDNKSFVYCASKGLAEKAAWADKDRKFTLTTILPPMVYGPPHQALSSMNGLNESSSDVWAIINSNPTEPSLSTGFPVGVDVRDVAKLHVRAIEKPDISANRRFLCIAYHIFHSEMANLLREYVSGDPAKLARIRGSSEGDPPYEHFVSDSREGEELLGKPFIGAKESIIQTAERLWEIEGNLNKKV